MKKNSLLIVTLLIGLLFTVCLSTYAAEVTMKIGHSHSIKTPRHKAVVRFKELVEDRSGGRIKVQIYPSGQLGTEAEMLESVKMGVIQATFGGQFEAASPKILLYTMPFLFEDIESVYNVTRGPLGEKIAEAAKENDIIIIATGVAGGLRNFTNNVRPIETPDDIKGLKMRTPPIDSIIKTIEAIGGNPVSVPYNDLYMALKTGVADGQENPFTNIIDKKLYEVQKYLSVVSYQFHPSPFYTSLKWFNSLDSDLQKIVKECAKESMVYQDKLYEEASKEELAFLEENMEVNYLTEEQRQLFIDKAQAVYDYYIDEGYFTREEIEEIRREANK